MPNINALVERNAKEPFRVIGVDTGDDEKTFRSGLEKNELTWSRIAWQGLKGTPIADLYRVSSYPTIFRARSRRHDRRQERHGDRAREGRRRGAGEDRAVDRPGAPRPRMG